MRGNTMTNVTHTERENYDALVSSLGEAGAKAFLALDAAIRQEMVKDLTPAFERWHAAVDRLVREHNSPKKPHPGLVLATSMVSYAAAYMIESGVMPKEEFVALSGATWDAVADVVAQMQKLT
jgi:hypothetical protein